MANKGSFAPGDPRAGRPKGRGNNATKEVRSLAREMVTDPEYLANLKKRLVEGKAGDLERILWQYAFGEPPQHAPSILDDFLDGPLLNGA